MTPNAIEVLLHYHSSPDTHPRINAPAVRDAMTWMLKEGLIEPESTKDPMPPLYGPHRTTERGKALVKMLCDTPLPIHAGWMDPRIPGVPL